MLLRMCLALSHLSIIMIYPVVIIPVTYLMMKKCLLFCIGLFLFEFSFGQITSLPPRNETSNDLALGTFTDQLKTAVQKKDVEWIIQHLDKDVMPSFEGQADIQSFITDWDIRNDSSEFWPMITIALNLGGVFLHDTADMTGRYQFVFPYAYDLQLNENDDPYYTGVITGKNVNLRKSPDTKSAIVTQLTYDIIRFMQNKQGELLTKSNAGGTVEWFKIQTYNKSHQGWVNSKFVYSLMGPRLFLFKDKHGDWKISAFITGE